MDQIAQESRAKEPWVETRGKRKNRALMVVNPGRGASASPSPSSDSRIEGNSTAERSFCSHSHYEKS